MEINARIAALRAWLQDHALDAYIVPSADPHGSEYVAEAWQRRAFISGFDGSAGTVIITADQAGLWTDSRYFIQAEQQLSNTEMTLFKKGTAAVLEPAAWLCGQLEAGMRVGLDGALFSIEAYADLVDELQTADIEVVALEENPVDAVWAEQRPALPRGAVRHHPQKWCGESAAEKIARLRAQLQTNAAAAVVIAALDEIAWLLNLRGADVAYNPVFIAYAVVSSTEVQLYVDPAKLDATVRTGLPEDVSIADYTDFEQGLAALAAKRTENGTPGRIWVDPQTISRWIYDTLKTHGAEIYCAQTPLAAWKAHKNDVELEGFRQAHLNDGIAMVRFARWLPAAVKAGGQDELSIVAHLEGLRRAQPGYLGPSFATICGYQEHGAIVHYAVDERSNRPVEPRGILLVDSGGQYEQGTTDITRTFCLGEPTARQTTAYTAVLKGHLALSRARFPAGTDGYQLDVLARAPLWAAGLNYGHGTGHGVGAALCVHEGPFSVSLRQNLTPLEVGNVLSVEPGYYRTDAFGIRIENLVYVEKKLENENGTFMGFVPLTLCPYSRRLIDRALLTAEERTQVDGYHRWVRATLAPHLAAPDRQWLQQATAPL